jgi:hypothetical protein
MTVKCSCYIEHESNVNEAEYINYCPTHQAAFDLLTACKDALDNPDPNIALMEAAIDKAEGRDS